ncbi:unnamed protein product [Enterobius vermicularis]|uniref:lysoplasmalogenase n=1 Tax=Enterobius vermicularis TaxID=51028 RepID=A0A0N4V7H7_ENTVE|nr:unnamed protein product [Enterobius vermicularis]
MASPYLGFPYFALVALFYRQTNGFVSKQTDLYHVWKTLPVLLLSILCYLIGSGAGLTGRLRTYTAIALFFGALGDYSIGEYGLLIGASSFLIGHIFYLLTFADRVTRIYYPIAIVLGTVDLAIAYLTLTPIAIEYPLKCTILMVYTTVLTVCVVLSASLFIYGGVNERPKQFNNLIRLLGFVLFYGSDSMLALHLLAFSMPWAEVLILFTYFGAQYLVLWATCITSRQSIIH